MSYGFTIVRCSGEFSLSRYRSVLQVVKLTGCGAAIINVIQLLSTLNCVMI